MLTSNKDKPVKQGWVLKKSGSSLLSSWKPKYLTLLANGTLNLFDNIQDTRPKHEIQTPNMRVEMVKAKFGMLSRSAISFIIITRSRKFYLAVQTIQEYDDWMRAISPSSVSVTEPCKSPDLDHDTISTYSHSTRRTYDDNDDAKSVYSNFTHDDDTISVRSSSRVGDYESGPDTLSFTSDSVLTPYELGLMAQEKVEEKGPQVKRRAPLSEERTEVVDWHSKFVEILKLRAITTEQTLQKDVQLMDLIGSFKEKSASLAREMVDSYHLGDKPQRKDNIVLRFAVNYNCASESEIEAAHKKTSTELRALNAVLTTQTPSDFSQFFTIFMTIIDYKGFRILAHAAPTCKFQPQHDLNPKRLIINESIASQTSGLSCGLNLKSHTVQVNDDRRVRIPLAATVEIHLDENGLHYITNLRDCLPIDSHSISDTVNKLQRFRPEFILLLPFPISSDCHTPASGATRMERSQNDEEGLKASRYLRENIIPAFVRALDGMEERVWDSASLTEAMHAAGINMRNLGMVCDMCTIPFVRTVLRIEMIARAVKTIYRDQTRAAVMHFRTVGATSIDDQMRAYTTTLMCSILGFGQETSSFLHERINPEMKNKFDCVIAHGDYLEIPRGGLFLAIQFHCGLKFEEGIDYQFTSQTPVPKSRFLSFQPRVKTLKGTQSSVLPLNPNETTVSFIVSRHFKSQGPRSKLDHCNESASILNYAASFYNNKGRFEESKLYAQAAVASAQKNHCLYGLATAQLIYAVAGLQATAFTAPEPSLLGWYAKALNVISWHWGSNSPMAMTLHDRISAVYHRAKDPVRAYEFHSESLGVAYNSLGKNHIVTGGYLTRAGCYLGNLGSCDEAKKYFVEALSIFTGSRADPSLIAEVHYHYADVLAQKGDYDKALENALKCRRIRESCFGFQDVRVIYSCRQVSKFLTEPYKDYQGVMTAIVKTAFRDAISNYEKVFRFLQNQQSVISRRRSMRRSQSTSSISAARQQNTTNTETRLVMAGPLVVSPFGWTPPFAKNLLHKLTKEIITMKLALVEVPLQKECIRTLRSKRLSNDADDFDADEARDIIVRMAAVNPSVYLDDVMQRINQGDDTAVRELEIVLVLTESEILGLRSE